VISDPKQVRAAPANPSKAVTPASLPTGTAGLLWYSPGDAEGGYQRAIGLEVVGFLPSGIDGGGGKFFVLEAVVLDFLTHHLPHARVGFA
jgi:hypothetical protein